MIDRRTRCPHKIPALPRVLGRRRRVQRTIAVLLTWAASAVAIATDDAGTPPDPIELTARINGGELAFLVAPPRTPVHHHQHRVTIDPGSLADGWITLYQCHSHLDAVPRAEIVFHEGRTRGLQVSSYAGMGKAWVDGASVQIVDVNEGATLCLTAQTRSLTDNGDGTYSLHNGPFMRRFLDGYYPLHVSLDVRFDGTGLRLLDVRPAPQEGFKVDAGVGRIYIDSWFEGRLRTELQFARH
jgi:hypothetical protein